MQERLNKSNLHLTNVISLSLGIAMFIALSDIEKNKSKIYVIAESSVFILLIACICSLKKTYDSGVMGVRYKELKAENDAQAAKLIEMIEYDPAENKQHRKHAVPVKAAQLQYLKANRIQHKTQHKKPNQTTVFFSRLQVSIIGLIHHFYNSFLKSFRNETVNAAAKKIESKPKENRTVKQLKYKQASSKATAVKESLSSTPQILVRIPQIKYVESHDDNRSDDKHHLPTPQISGSKPIVESMPVEAPPQTKVLEVAKEKNELPSQPVGEDKNAHNLESLSEQMRIMKDEFERLQKVIHTSVVMPQPSAAPVELESLSEQMKKMKDEFERWQKATQTPIVIHQPSAALVENESTMATAKELIKEMKELLPIVTSEVSRLDQKNKLGDTAWHLHLQAAHLATLAEPYNMDPGYGNVCTAVQNFQRLVTQFIGECRQLKIDISVNPEASTARPRI